MSEPAGPTAPWWRRVPEPMWWAVLPVLAGFVVSWRDVVQGWPADLAGCALLDWADLVSGSLAVLLVLAGIVVQVRRPRERRCQPQLLMGLVVFLGGLGVYHLLTGLGRLGGVCS
ncbi:hypothetical protein [uncultured Nocardioides sp.]|uniref:hypothetical protein n=1 Tax=uncultured Nocardioides sp. TaxID=198441 RepID=UPI00262C466F|nr:hypothetical protein [uncultured Nocardioides sp.]